MKSNLGYRRQYRKEERKGGGRERLTERQTDWEGGKRQTKKEVMRSSAFFPRLEHSLY